MSRPHLRVLCLDGGGVRGAATIEMLRSLSEKCEDKEPYEMFNLIVGTSTGGILALLLALKVPLNEVEDIYNEISGHVFEKGILRGGYFDSVLRFVKGATGWPLYDHGNLVDAVKAQLEKSTENREMKLQDVGPQEGEERTPLLGLVSRVNGNTANPFFFTNFRVPRAVGMSDVPAWQAVRATSAAPSFFAPIEIDGLEYIDGGVGHNNPTRDVLAHLLTEEEFRGREIEFLISMGTGLQSVELHENQSLSNVMKLLVDTATQCEQTHLHLLAESEADGHSLQGRYIRLNPDGGAGNHAMDDTNVMKVVKVATRAYINSNRQLFREAASMVNGQLVS